MLLQEHARQVLTVRRPVVRQEPYAFKERRLLNRTRLEIDKLELYSWGHF